MNKKTYYLDYQGIYVPFSELDRGILDRCIREGIPVGTDFDSFSMLTSPGEIAYDIGGYLGSHAIQLALLGCLTYSFEPSPFNFSRLQSHCQRFRQIKCYDVAFHDKSYDVNTRFRDCNSQDTFDPLGDPAQNIKYRVFNDYTAENNLPLPSFLKIDIEGMESIVLNTMKDLITKKRSKFLIELHWANDGIQVYDNCPAWREKEDGGFDFNFFFESEYLVWKFDGREMTKLDKIDTCQGLPSIICVPKEQITKNENT